MSKRIIVLNAIAASGNDFIEEDGWIKITDPALGATATKSVICRKKDILVGSVTKVAYTAGTARVITLVPTVPAAVGTKYSGYAEEFNSANTGVKGDSVKAYYSYESVSGDTADTVAAAISAQLLAAKTAGKIAATASVSTSTVTLTAASADKQIILKAQQVGAGTTITITTPGSQSKGTAAKVLADVTGQIDSTLYPTGTQYTVYKWRMSPVKGEGLNGEQTHIDDLYLALNEGDADLAALTAVIDAMIDGLDRAGSVAGPEGIAVGA